jgi:hypothetical protein
LPTNIATVTGSPTKKRANLVIGAFVAIMIATPLSYYTVRSDRYDERFAWRMFSTMRMVRCSPKWMVGESSQPIKLGRTFHEAWVGIARRARRSVTGPMTDFLCEKNPGQPVRLLLTCRSLTGKTEVLSDGTSDLCGGQR